MEHFNVCVHMRCAKYTFPLRFRKAFRHTVQFRLVLWCHESLLLGCGICANKAGCFHRHLHDEHRIVIPDFRAAVIGVVHIEQACVLRICFDIGIRVGFVAVPGFISAVQNRDIAFSARQNRCSQRSKCRLDVNFGRADALSAFIVAVMQQRVHAVKFRGETFA